MYQSRNKFITFERLAGYKTPEGVMHACRNARASHVFLGGNDMMPIKEFMDILFVLTRHTNYELNHILSLIQDNYLLGETIGRIMEQNPGLLDYKG